MVWWSPSLVRLAFWLVLKGFWELFDWSSKLKPGKTSKSSLIGLIMYFSRIVYQQLVH